MLKLETIQKEIAELPPDAQQIIFDLVDVLKKRYFSNLQKPLEKKVQDWSDFIGCMEAEPDLSRNYKTYLSNELDEKYDHR
ncbi:MAG: hypothetical protein AUK48_11630 [Oscillatoriales cyanobacterium CG2_30_44_21]|nr:MAG: hypothetical protein AUK48_11630 [Oscillatoriales cyanobacterium CG2_30_44_21]